MPRFESGAHKKTEKPEEEAGTHHVSPDHAEGQPGGKIIRMPARKLSPKESTAELRAKLKAVKDQREAKQKKEREDFAASDVGQSLAELREIEAQRVKEEQAGPKAEDMGDLAEEERALPAAVRKILRRPEPKSADEEPPSVFELAKSFKKDEKAAETSPLQAEISEAEKSGDYRQGEVIKAIAEKRKAKEQDEIAATRKQIAGEMPDAEEKHRKTAIIDVRKVRGAGKKKEAPAEDLDKLLKEATANRENFDRETEEIEAKGGRAEIKRFASEYKKRDASEEVPGAAGQRIASEEDETAWFQKGDKMSADNERAAKEAPDLRTVPSSVEMRLDQVKDMDIPGFDYDGYASLTRRQNSIDKMLEQDSLGEIKLGIFKKLRMKWELGSIGRALKPYETEVETEEAAKEAQAAYERMTPEQQKAWQEQRRTGRRIERKRDAQKTPRGPSNPFGLKG